MSTSSPLRSLALAAVGGLALATSLPAQDARIDREERATSAPRVTKAVVLGGMLAGPSRLALVKGEIARGRWALVSDVTRDDTRERWTPTATTPASRDTYVLWASSSAVRRYTQDGARGFYAEAGAGVAQLSLRSRDDAGTLSTRKGTLPMASWGVGLRRALGGERTFVEVAYRSAIPLQTRHLHAAATPPAGSRDEAVTPQSWYLGRGKASGQFFAALGIRL